MSRYKSILLGTLSSQLFLIVTMLLNLLAVPLYLKFLNREGYGLYVVLSQAVGFLGLLDFGLSASVSRSLAMNRQEPHGEFVSRVVSTGFFIHLGLGLMVILVALGLSSRLPQWLHLERADTLVASSLFIALSVWGGAQLPLRAVVGLFFAHERQTLAHFTNFLFVNLSLALSLCFLHLGHGLWSFVYASAAATLLNAVVLAYLLRRHYPELRIGRAHFDSSLLGEMFRYGFFLFLNGVGWIIVANTDRFLIGALVSLSAVTMFALTVRLPEIAMQLIFRVTDNAFPVMVEAHTHEGALKLKRIHQKLMVTAVSLSAIAFWLILSLNAYFLQLWVGPDLFAGQLVLVTACVLMAYHGFLHVSAVCLNGAGCVRGMGLLSLVEAALNLALSIWLGRRFGVIGVIGATLVAGVLTHGWYTPRLAMSYLKITPREYLAEPILRPFALISVAGVALYALSRAALDAASLNWVTFFAFGLFAALALAVFTWLLVLRRELGIYVPVRFQRLLCIAG